MISDSKSNDDVKQHLLNIEARLDRISVSPQLDFDSLSAPRDDEIDLREIWSVLWDGKWWVTSITFLFAVGSVIFALSLPNQYKAEVVLAPAQEQNGGMSGLAAQYGGLAAMAGINLGAASNSDVDQALALVTSWPFLHRFVEKYKIKPLVMAVEGWDRASGRIIYDEEIYNSETREWTREPKPDRPVEPTSYEVYEKFIQMLAVNQDTATGLIQLSVEHYVPSLAYEWVGLLTLELNRHFQMRDIREANRNIDYLREKVEETSIAEMQSVFYRMIESQMKTLMLAEVSDEYLVKSVVEARLPERKSKPRKALICIIGTILGSLLGMISVFVGRFLRVK